MRCEITNYLFTKRLIFQIISFLVEKIINSSPEKAPDDISDPVINAACACRDEEFLHEFCEDAVQYSDNDSDPQGFFPVVFPVLGILLSVPPQGNKCKTGVHNYMSHFVEADDGLYF